MEFDPFKIIEDLRPYYSTSSGKRVLEELYSNAHRTLNSVYLFRYFDEYVTQLKADRNEDKKEVYWDASYHEKLIDYIKISVAFETYNKALLIENGYVVHKIKKTKDTKSLFKRQSKGLPIRIDQFKDVSEIKLNNRIKKYYFANLTPALSTISYSTTLNEYYQQIIQLDKELLYRLKEINEKRNKLHFFTEFKGAFEQESHISKWRQIKDLSFSTIEAKVIYSCIYKS